MGEINQPNVFPTGKRFLVLVDKGEKVTAQGIHLPEAERRYTGTVVRLPSEVKLIGTDEDQTIYGSEAKLNMFPVGTYIAIGTRIQWSSQSGFATPIPISELVDGQRITTLYLLFTVDDVDIILPN